MKNVYTSLKRFAFAIALIFITSTAIAQPASVQVNWINGCGTGCTFSTGSSLTNFVDVSKATLQNVSTGTGLSFLFNGGGGTSAGVWSNGLPMSGYDLVILPSSVSGSAKYNGTTPALLSRTAISNYYYTFNVSRRSTFVSRVDEDLAVLQTLYNPVDINSVNRNPVSPNSNDSVTVSIVTSSIPAVGEYFYVRYSTSSSFSSSAIRPINMIGNAGTAKIPPFAGGSNVYYYVFSSNRTLSQLTSSASTFGGKAYNLLSLKINNNSNTFYNYSVTSCAVAPTSITSSVPGCLKSGNTATLTMNGGSLPNGGNFEWYKDVCGTGTFLGTGNSINVSPTSPTNYFVRAVDGCGITSCATINIVVGDSSVAPTSITGVNSICQNVTFKLKRVGGSLGTGAAWHWYRTACGGSGVPALGTGDSIFTQMNPGTSIYY